ncbi:hypothetical protein I2486_06560 [Cellulophaga sp. E16_2]|uniref:hypothetical protein n=1 Tax=unclassified Cellulophaga TaxID=2634405 RepID=UPI0013FD1B13|nr:MULTISPECIES: hypothetical protein [unclassified Cellulophaga]MBO0591067.1 hypothetical protein [Cellulophaga sp. E16_2]
MKLLSVLILAISIKMLSIDIDTVRSAYKEAGQDKTKIEAFNSLLLNISKDDSNVTLVAYKGASITLLAKNEKSIKNKKNLFIEGVSYIEYAIEKSPKNIELRFIRLGIQENTPKLLKYKGNIEEDKQFILKQFKNISSSNLKKHIKDYVLQSKAFSDEEKSVISDH